MTDKRIIGQEKKIQCVLVEIDLKVKLFGQPNKKSIFYSFKIGYNYLKRLLNYFLIQKVKSRENV